MADTEAKEATGERTEERAEGEEQAQAPSQHSTLQQSPATTTYKKRKRAIDINTQEEIGANPIGQKSRCNSQEGTDRSTY